MSDSLNVLYAMEKPGIFRNLLNREWRIRGSTIVVVLITIALSAGFIARLRTGSSDAPRRESSARNSATSSANIVQHKGDTSGATAAKDSAETSRFVRAMLNEGLSDPEVERFFERQPRPSTDVNVPGGVTAETIFRDAIQRSGISDAFNRATQRYPAEQRASIGRLFTLRGVAFASAKNRSEQFSQEHSALSLLSDNDCVLLLNGEVDLLQLPNKYAGADRGTLTRLADLRVEALRTGMSTQGKPLPALESAAVDRSFRRVFGEMRPSSAKRLKATTDSGANASPAGQCWAYDRMQLQIEHTRHRDDADVILLSMAIEAANDATMEAQTPPKHGSMNGNAAYRNLARSFRRIWR